MDDSCDLTCHRPNFFCFPTHVDRSNFGLTSKYNTFSVFSCHTHIMSLKEQLSNHLFLCNCNLDLFNAERWCYDEGCKYLFEIYAANLVDEFMGILHVNEDDAWTIRSNLEELYLCERQKKIDEKIQKLGFMRTGGRII